MDSFVGGKAGACDALSAAQRSSRQSEEGRVRDSLVRGVAFVDQRVAGGLRRQQSLGAHDRQQRYEAAAAGLAINPYMSAASDGFSRSGQVSTQNFSVAASRDLAIRNQIELQAQQLAGEVELHLRQRQHQFNQTTAQNRAIQNRAIQNRAIENRAIQQAFESAKSSLAPQLRAESQVEDEAGEQPRYAQRAASRTNRSQLESSRSEAFKFGERILRQRLEEQCLGTDPEREEHRSSSQQHRHLQRQQHVQTRLQNLEQERRYPLNLNQLPFENNSNSLHAFGIVGAASPPDVSAYQLGVPGPEMIDGEAAGLPLNLHRGGGSQSDGWTTATTTPPSATPSGTSSSGQNDHSDPSPSNGGKSRRSRGQRAGKANNAINSVKICHYYKTKLCPWLPEGRCRWGSRCNWAHSAQELRPSVDLTCTKLCENIIRKGACNSRGCRFAHSREQLLATSDVYKTSICLFWTRGGCTAGACCRYAHGKEDLREKPDVPLESKRLSMAIHESIPIPYRVVPAVEAVKGKDDEVSETCEDGGTGERNTESNLVLTHSMSNSAKLFGVTNRELVSQLLSPQATSAMGKVQQQERLFSLQSKHSEGSHSQPLALKQAQVSCNSQMIGAENPASLSYSAKQKQLDQWRLRQQQLLEEQRQLTQRQVELHQQLRAHLQHSKSHEQIMSELSPVAATERLSESSCSALVEAALGGPKDLVDCGRSGSAVSGLMQARLAVPQPEPWNSALGVSRSRSQGSGADDRANLVTDSGSEEKRVFIPDVRHSSDARFNASNLLQAPVSDNGDSAVRRTLSPHMLRSQRKPYQGTTTLEARDAESQTENPQQPSSGPNVNVRSQLNCPTHLSPTLSVSASLSSKVNAYNVTLAQSQQRVVGALQQQQESRPQLSPRSAAPSLDVSGRKGLSGGRRASETAQQQDARPPAAVTNAVVESHVPQFLLNVLKDESLLNSLDTSTSCGGIADLLYTAPAADVMRSAEFPPMTDEKLLSAFMMGTDPFQCSRDGDVLRPQMSFLGTASSSAMFAHSGDSMDSTRSGSTRESMDQQTLVGFRNTEVGFHGPPSDQKSQSRWRINSSTEVLAPTSSGKRWTWTPQASDYLTDVDDSKKGTTRRTNSESHTATMMKGGFGLSGGGASAGSSYCCVGQAGKSLRSTPIKEEELCEVSSGDEPSLLSVFPRSKQVDLVDSDATENKPCVAGSKGTGSASNAPALTQSPSSEALIFTSLEDAPFGNF